MIRVLQCVNNMHRAGLETMLMNYYRHIDRNQIQFDFLTHRPERSDYDDEIEALGGKVYYAPRLYPQNLAAYFRYMKAFFREHPEYQIVHSHIDAMSFLPLLAAKRAKVPVRIAHSHNTAIDMDYKYILKQLYRRCIPAAASDYCACGKEAGKFLFGSHDFTVLPNAIDAGKFTYDAGLRETVRKELKLQNKFVIGHVGRFSAQKNHVFLLEIFERILRSNDAAQLLLIGTGEKEEEIKQRAAQMGIDARVLFMGSQNDVGRYYQAMDVFVMSSLFEGVPVVGIEAQYAGLPCVFSDKVPEEVAFSGLCRFVPLNETADTWAEIVLESAQKERCAPDTADSAYDIRNSAQLLMKYYIDLAAEKTK